jgi:hypothetical protein
MVPKLRILVGAVSDYRSLCHMGITRWPSVSEWTLALSTSCGGCLPFHNILASSRLLYNCLCYGLKMVFPYFLTIFKDYNYSYGRTHQSVLERGVDSCFFAGFYYFQVGLLEGIQMGWYSADDFLYAGRGVTLFFERDK